MTSISGIPASSGRMWTPTVKADSVELARFREQRANISPPPSPEEIAQQIAKQNAIKAHTAFKVDGKIIAVRSQGGGTLTTGNDGGAALSASKEGSKLGLTGAALDDFIAEKMEQTLRQKFGDRLEVVRYDADNAPTMGELKSGIFGSASKGSTAAIAPKVTFDAETLATIERVKEAQAARAAQFEELVNGSRSKSAD